MKKGFIICKKVDGFGNDEYSYLEEGVFENPEDAQDVIKKIMKEEHLERLKGIQEEITERIEALERGSYITGAHDDISLSIQAGIAKDFHSAHYGDFYLNEIEIKEEKAEMVMKEEELLTGYKPLENMLERFKVDEDGHYNRYIYEENDDEEQEIDFDEELNKAMKAIGIPEYDFTNCGGFDSCGYSIDCYCLAYIDKSGHLITIPVAFECM